MGVMPVDRDDTAASRPVLLCFDGSEGATRAIASAGSRLRSAGAVVLTVWEPFALWQPYDPATILTVPVAKLAAEALDVDAVAEDMASETTAQGVSLAGAAGFATDGRTVRGTPWRTICDTAAEIDAATIVLGARGRSRVQSMLLGSVSSAVAVHARQPVLIVPPCRADHG